MNKIRWGILSVSNHYRMRVHPQLVGPEGEAALTEVVALASRDREKAEAAARELGIPNACGSYEELLARSDIDAVYIPLPNHLHAAWVKKAADAGKHVLCEKPFALDAGEAADAIAHAHARGVKVMEAFMYRFHPQWIHAREVVRSGEIGRVMCTHIQFSFNNRDPRNIRNMLDAGGGAIMDIGCYACSSGRVIIGKEPLRALSLVNRDPEFRTDALSAGILDFGEAHALFSVSTQAFPSQRVEIVGTSGSISIQIPFNMYADVPAEMRIVTGVGPRTVRLGPAPQYRLMFDAFSRAILEHTLVPTPPEDAVANMRVIDALFRSEKSGGWEPIDVPRSGRQG
ncbi:MAG: Gfo/Idh/MocA family oxidoreductase [Rectinema sp.]|nr:Gfo/Idh/MocA family oxidoreductase [Rectinema sp.]